MGDRVHIVSGSLIHKYQMDIGITWNNTIGRGDWSFLYGDIASGPDLVSAVLASLFTDRVAPPDYVPVDGNTDRRGHWSDTYEDRPCGSLLWLLDRAKFSAATNLVQQARDYCQSALQWLIDDGIAATVEVQVRRANPTSLAIGIVITEPITMAQIALQFQYVWRQSP